MIGGLKLHMTLKSTWESSLNISTLDMLFVIGAFSSYGALIMNSTHRAESEVKDNGSVVPPEPVTDLFVCHKKDA